MIIKRLYPKTNRVTMPLLSRVKMTYLGQFFVRKLERYYYIRLFALTTWNFFILTLHWVHKIFHLTDPQYSCSLANFSTKKIQIFPRQFCTIPFPETYPSKGNDFLKIRTDFEFPEIYITTLKNFTVIGSSKLIFNERMLLYDDLFDPNLDLMPEEYQKRLFFSKKKSLAHLNFKKENPTIIPKGIAFTDALSHNYAHFLTEILPKIAIYFKGSPDFSVKVIIDLCLHENILQAMEMVVGSNLEVIGLEPNEVVFVRSLRVMSTCGSVPFEPRPGTFEIAGHSHGEFSSLALMYMRNLIQSKISYIPKAGVVLKLYIKRTASNRNLLNITEVEDMLLKNGFITIIPEAMSFIEQVKIFSNADIVLGPAGAAFANIIFCKPEAKIIILAPETQNLPYGYWQKIACAVGCQVSYMLGKPLRENDVHSDYYVNESALLTLIRSVIK